MRIIREISKDNSSENNWVIRIIEEISVSECEQNFESLWLNGRLKTLESVCFGFWICLYLNNTYFYFSYFRPEATDKYKNLHFLKATVLISLEV